MENEKSHGVAVSSSDKKTQWSLVLAFVVIGLIGISMFWLVLDKYFTVFGNFFVSSPLHSTEPPSANVLAEVRATKAEWGQFGDYLGGFLNPIFAFFNFAMLCLTIILQNRQLAQNSEELKISTEAIQLARDELLVGREIQKATEKALKEQIEIARSEKDFNAALSLIELLKDRDVKLNEELAKLTEIGSSETSDVAIGLNVNKKQGELLSSLIESGFDEVVMRLSGLDKNPIFTLPSYDGYSFDVHYIYRENKIKVDIDCIENSDFNRYRFDGPITFHDIFARRNEAMLKAKRMLQIMIDHHSQEGVWMDHAEASKRFSGL